LSGHSQAVGSGLLSSVLISVGDSDMLYCHQVPYTQIAQLLRVGPHRLAVVRKPPMLPAAALARLPSVGSLPAPPPPVQPQPVPDTGGLTPEASRTTLPDTPAAPVVLARPAGVPPLNLAMAAAQAQAQAPTLTPRSAAAQLSNFASRLGGFAQRAFAGRSGQAPIVISCDEVSMLEELLDLLTLTVRVCLLSANHRPLTSATGC
jgi:hypothetical protein